MKKDKKKTTDLSNLFQLFNSLHHFILLINSLASSDSFNTFLFKSVNLIKTNQSDQFDLSYQSDLFHQSNSEYHDDYTSTSSVNISITKKVFKVTRIFISVSMIVSLFQEQIQIINDTV